MPGGCGYAKVIHMDAKVLKNSIAAADNGRVEYTVVANNQRYHGYIEETFFQDVLGQSNAPLSQKLALAATNVSYFEALASQQLSEGRDEVVVR